ncbi:conserved hypothetical protein [Histoplasma capsulatum H143]|uniref:Uncharacterized protein n=1 Tax=Ajellomyces capsulatus (strain H143) TaxID=544712 RepID=C6H5U3_AJECH|nr:conserved hypothetical protein [Histoplasma capsulatum H143]
MDESDTNPPRRTRTSGTRRLCTHAATGSLTRPPRTFGPAPSSSITPSLHRCMAYAARTCTPRCDFSSLAYMSQGFPAGVDGSHRKIATLELKLKLGSFEPRAAEKGGWKRSPFQLFLRPTRGFDGAANANAVEGFVERRRPKSEIGVFGQTLVVRQREWVGGYHTEVEGEEEGETAGGGEEKKRNSMDEREGRNGK